MACRRKSAPRLVAVTVTTTLIVTCMLAFAQAASARVTVVPGSVRGGGTETFAVRLSNEQPDLVTTRLELTFPADVVIPLVEVAPVSTWDVTVTMRRVDPPVTIDGNEVDEAVASIVWTGGEVAPKQFEQFLVTAGPLPADGARMVLAAAQGYEDGTVDRWTEPARPGWPGAPTITVAPSSAVAEAGRPSDSGAGVLPWILLLAGVVVAGVGGVVGYRLQERRKRMARPRLASIGIGKLPTGAGRR